MSIRNQAAIAGVGQTSYSFDSQTTDDVLALQAVRQALDDAGLSPEQVDGIVRYGYDHVTPATIAKNLGIPALRWYGDVPFGGVALCGVVMQSASAIACGQASVVVVYRSLNERSGVRYGRAERHFTPSQAGPILAVGDRTPSGELSGPYGLLVPGQSFALTASRYAAEAGIDDDALSQSLCRVAVQQRAYANRNPAAIMRGRPMTEEDYFGSRMIYSPLRLFDMCLESDGAAAMVICRDDIARTTREPIHIKSGFQFLGPHTEPISVYAPDLLRPTPPALIERLFADAGVSRKEMDFAQIYDATSFAVLSGLEQYGFSQPLQAWRYVRQEGTGPASPLPVNTHGGHLSEAYIHGMNHMLEAVRQLRGASSNQIPAASHGIVINGAAGAVILGHK